MRNLFFFLTITLIALPAVGQKVIKDHVAQSAVKISDINPGAEKLGDFEKIGNAIGDAQIVMIGEQDHGDATTFLAKTQLVKYLHEKKGFNIIAFESDFWGLNYGWDKLPKIKDSIIQFIKGNIFGVWTACYACNDLLFQYIPASFQTNNPLLVTGFDPQLILSYSYANLLQKFDSVLLHYKIPTRLKENYESETRPLINSIYFVNDTAADSKYNDREIVLSGILNELREKITRK